MLHFVFIYSDQSTSLHSSAQSAKNRLEEYDGTDAIIPTIHCVGHGIVTREQLAELAETEWFDRVNKRRQP